MKQIVESRTNNGIIQTTNLNIPNDTKVILIWDNEEEADNKSKKLNSLPKGIIMNKPEGIIDSLNSFPNNAVEFQRIIRDNEWN